METKIFRVDEANIQRDILLQAGELIRQGKLVAFPTETVYGLGANALSGSACADIYKAKGRPSDNPLIVHVADPKEVLSYAYEDRNGLFSRLAKEFMPGPLTVVLKKKGLIPDTTTGGLETVALRCPANPIARELIRCSGVPIAAPSANRSGSPSPTKAQHVIEDLDGRISMILHGQHSAIGLESTIVSLDDDGVKLLRPGFITVEDLEPICGKVRVDKAVTERLAANEAPLAPGMKYRHYAPETDLVMIEGEDLVVRNFLLREAASSCGVLCFDEDLEALSQVYSKDRLLSLGKKEDLAFQGAMLFDVLRQVDLMQMSKVYVRKPETKGFGLAVYNRLIKACAYQLITLP